MKKINRERVDFLMTGLAKFGACEGKGITRLAYSEVDRHAQDWLLEQISDLNLQVREDAVGNVYLRLPGKDGSLPPVASGSHLDTVIHGGAYDGVCGVVGALEALYMLSDTVHKRSIEVIIFRAEESSRFGFATIGSKLLTGEAVPDNFIKGNRRGDISYKEALAEWGCAPERYAEAVRKPGDFKSFCEMHIEQGRVLEETGTQLGIVHSIAAPTRFKIQICGVADHSGATPMGFRHDALVSAAKLVLAVEQAAANEKLHGTVGTVGVVDVEPGSINVVPGNVTLWVDVRGGEVDSIQRTLESIQKAMEDVAESDEVEVSMEMLASDLPVILDKDLSVQSEEICRSKGITFRHMMSGAGHDAMHMAKLCPATMLFLPCRGGISHNPAEFAELDDICCAIEVLAEILQREAAE